MQECVAGEAKGNRKDLLQRKSERMPQQKAISCRSDDDRPGRAQRGLLLLVDRGEIHGRAGSLSPEPTWLRACEVGEPVRFEIRKESMKIGKPEVPSPDAKVSGARRNYPSEKYNREGLGLDKRC